MCQRHTSSSCLLTLPPQVMFPYSHQHVRSHLDSTYGSEETQADIQAIRLQVGRGSTPGHLDARSSIQGHLQGPFFLSFGHIPSFRTCPKPVNESFMEFWSHSCIITSHVHSIVLHLQRAPKTNILPPDQSLMPSEWHWHMAVSTFGNMAEH